MSLNWLLSEDDNDNLETDAQSLLQRTLVPNHAPRTSHYAQTQVCMSKSSQSILKQYGKNHKIKNANDNR